MPDTIEIQNFPLWKQLDGRRVPLSFDIEVTARCNNNCRHCYINLPASDKEAKRKELSSGQIASIADQAVDMGALWCLITGGEPLLREDFADIYLYLKKKGLLVSVFTNATLITGEHIGLFKKYPPRDIEVSVYGVTRETYQKVTRSPGSFAAFTRGLSLLLENGIRVRFKAMALKSNVGELPEIARFYRERTKDYFRFDPFLHLRYDGNARRNKEIISERLSPEEIATVEQADPERIESLVRDCDRLINPEFEHINCNHLFHCGAGNDSFSVSYDGYFRLCSSLNHPDCRYDLKTGSLLEAWREFAPRIRDMRSNRKEFLDTCRRCPIINLCLCCPTHAHLESGELDATVEYYCGVAHARAAALQAKLPGATLNKRPEPGQGRVNG